MAYAAASDVQTRLGRPLTEDETAMTNIRLADAERMILRRLSGAWLTRSQPAM